MKITEKYLDPEICKKCENYREDPVTNDQIVWDKCWHCYKPHRYVVTNEVTNFKEKKDKK